MTDETVGFSPHTTRERQGASPMPREYQVTEDTFPHAVFPTGWFQVAWSDEVEPGTIRPARYFGRDLIVYRTAEGAPVVMAAHCPHMGAHIGYGGWVEGCDVVCPFHGWRWAPNGENLEIPSQQGKTSGRSIRTWETSETNGIIWVWHDELRRPPTCEPPPERRGEQPFLPIYPDCVHKWDNVRARPQYVTENVTDLDHLRWVHKNTGKIDVLELKDDGDRMVVRQSSVTGHGKKATWLTPDGPVENTIYIQLFGIGTIMIDFGELLDNSLLMQTQTPIDHDHSDLFITVLTVQDPNEEGDRPKGRALRRVQEQIKQADRDMPIWSNMKYLEKAAYTKPEGMHVKAVRDWCRRFYPEPAA
jgi:3-ketosteroid 9alpha-monooxygenase subunit A